MKTHAQESPLNKDKISPEENEMKSNSLEYKELLMDLVDKEYFKGFLDKIDEYEKRINHKTGEADMSDRIYKLFKINTKEIKSQIDNNLSTLVEKINKLLNDKNVEISKMSSFYDIFNNSTLFAIANFIWILEHMDDDNIEIQNKINNLDYFRVESAIKCFSEENGAFGESGDMTYYLNELCADNQKLESEINSKTGFILNFEEFFITDPNKLGGSKKLPYFRFFSELQKGTITAENIEGYLKTIDDSYVNKDKLMSFVEKK